MRILAVGIFILASTLSVASGAAPLDDLLKTLQADAAQPFSAQRGKTFWAQKHPAADGGQARSCSLCHSNDLTRKGAHIRTHKIIQPMAPASNPKRLTKLRKMRKWLLRNCKFVLARTCSAQEKGDILTFLRDFNRP